MQSSVEKVSELGRKLNVELPADQIEQAIQVKLKSIAKSVKIQGFRPGKVPLRIVEQKYRGSATSEVLGDLIQSSLYEALNKEGLVPAGRPEIVPDAIEKGGDFSYVANFDVYPEFDKLSLSGVKLLKPESQVIEDDVDNVIENMRKQQLTWKLVDRKAKDEDRVIVDFEGRIDGEVFEGGSANDYPVVIGQKQMLADFETALVGKKSGEDIEAKVEFPPEYADDLAGKTAVFSISIKSVSKAELPAIDTEFAKSFGVEDGDLDELRKEVRSNLESNLESKLSSMLRQRTFDALVEANPKEMPHALVKEEVDRMLQEQKNQLVNQGISEDLLKNLPEPDFDKMKPQAQKRVAMGLMMMEIVKQVDMTPDKDRVEERIKTMASSYEDPEEFMQYYRSNEQALAQVQSVVLEEQVVEHLLGEADVEVESLIASELLSAQ